LEKYVGPNEEVLEAQARVCTGPHQSRPLGVKEGDPEPGRILELVLQSLRGELPQEEQVSEAQMGAFFAAMTLRREFDKKTGWSAAEERAFAQYGDALERHLTEDLKFLLDPERELLVSGQEEEQVGAALRHILRGRHLSYAQTRQILEAMLGGGVRPALMAAVLIGQRMNIEDEEEVRAYLDAVLRPEEAMAVEVDSLTHFGQPFDGATRYWRPTLFVAAVRAALGRPSVLHGVDEMPPKQGVTEEQVFKVLGARTDLSRAQAALLLEDREVGMAYVSQREYAPGAYRLAALRLHIKKRPPWATTEKAQQLFICPGPSYMVIGFYHAGYEDKLLRLMWERGFQTGLVIKGEEGSSHYALRLGKPSGEGRKAINFTQGFRRVDGQRQDFAADIDPVEFGFKYEQSPRPEQINPQAFAELGMAALSGVQGHIYDRIVFNAAMTDYWLGLCKTPGEALEQARAAVDSGDALAHLQRYIKQSHL
jgi:anthranilate phosphoribosyltransferase